MMVIYFCHYLKPVGIVDFAESTASSGVVHTAVSHNTLFLASLVSLWLACLPPAGRQTLQSLNLGIICPTDPNQG